MIFNRTLSATEIGALYNASANKYSRNFTELPNATYLFKGTAVDAAGLTNVTEWRTVTILDNAAPNITVWVPQKNGTVFPSNSVINFNISLNETGSAVLSLDNFAINYTMLQHNSLTGTEFNYTNHTLTHGFYTVRFFANDTSGNNNFTVSKLFYLNNPPAAPIPSINSSDGTNRTLQDLHVMVTPDDIDIDGTNITIYWFNGTILHLVQQFNGTLEPTTSMYFNLSNGNTTKGENWSAGAIFTDGVNTTAQVNTSALFIKNTVPPVISLKIPATGTSTTDRTPNLQWFITSDDDGDTLAYHLNLSCVGGCAVDNRLQTGYSAGTADVNSDLLYLYDNNFYYNWTVIAFDGEANSSAWATGRHINITALVSIILAPGNASVDFDSIPYLGTNDTEDDRPFPFLLENNGNSFVNVSMGAYEDLWVTQAGPSAYFQAKVANYSKEVQGTGAFVWGTGQTEVTYFNVPLAQMTVDEILFLVGFNYTDASDTAEVDINVTVPPNEGPGKRSANVSFTASLAECAGGNCWTGGGGDQ